MHADNAARSADERRRTANHGLLAFWPARRLACQNAKQRTIRATNPLDWTGNVVRIH